MSDEYTKGVRAGLIIAAKWVRERGPEWYPTDIFPDPPPKQHGTSVDSCSARAFRHASHAWAEQIEQLEHQVRAGERDVSIGERLCPDCTCPYDQPHSHCPNHPRPR
jgi:hypothetical protein